MSPSFPGARRPLPFRLTAALLVLAGCGPSDRAEVAQSAQAAQAPVSKPEPTLATAVVDTLVPQGDTTVPTPIAATLPSRARGIRRRPPVLSPRAESLAARMVFVPRTQSWYITAARGRRLLVDVGRVDADLRGDSLRRGAYREAAERLSPLSVGALLRLRGPWGVEDVRVTGFDVWNGRIVATLQLSRGLDSLARRVQPLVGTALRLTADDSAAAVLAESLAAWGVTARSDSAGWRAAQASAGVAARVTPGAAPAIGRDTLPAGLATDSAALACRDTLPDPLKERATLVRDSLELDLRLNAMPGHERLQSTVTIASSRAQGCFGSLGRVLVIVSLRTTANEYVRERLVALDDSGRVAPLRVHDSRFKAHDAIYAFDADGDGVDDLAARGLAERAGALVVLRLDPKAKRAERIAGGFAWEAR